VDGDYNYWRNKKLGGLIMNEYFKDIENPTLEELEKMMEKIGEHVGFTNNRDGFVFFHLCKMMIEHMKERD